MEVKESAGKEKKNERSLFVIMADVDMQKCTLSNLDDMMQSKMVQRQIERASYMEVLPKVVNSH